MGTLYAGAIDAKKYSSSYIKDSESWPACFRCTRKFKNLSRLPVGMCGECYKNSLFDQIFHVCYLGNGIWGRLDDES